MRYNGLNNMFFSLCQINDNHSLTSSSHTKKTKSYNYSKHHKNTLIDNKALSLFKMDDHEKVIGLIQKMKRIYDSLPSGKITKEKMAEVLSENPAKLYGAWPRKGAILAGSDADLVVYDPEADTVLCGEELISAAKYTPYEGVQTRGSIAQVYLRGQLAVDHGEVKVGPVGEFVARKTGVL